jgi:hypothetical protein
MAKSKRSSKRSSKKNKNKACRKRGHGAVFCDLAEAGRVLTTISVVLNFVICAIVLIVSIVAVVKNKEWKPFEDEPSMSTKTVGEGGILFSLIWAAWIGLVWWLVEKYDIISVISMSFWLLSIVVGIIVGANFHKKIRESEQKLV